MNRFEGTGFEPGEQVVTQYYSRIISVIPWKSFAYDFEVTFIF